MAVAGSYAYVADVSKGLQVIDVRNPTNCVRVGGYDTSGSAYGVAVSGSLTVQGSATDIKFTWDNNSHIFMGTVSADSGAYHIEGTVYVYGAANPPGFTVGDGVLCVPDLTGMKWKILQANRNYSIQIGTQQNLPDGTATFTGIWSDRTAVTGTLRYEADGTISISFTWSDPKNVQHQFDGLVKTLESALGQVKAARAVTTSDQLPRAVLSTVKVVPGRW